MERITNDNRLDPVSRLHIIYGTVIMIMAVAFAVTLLTMKSSYDSNMQEMASTQMNAQAQMQMPEGHPATDGTAAAQPAGGAGAPQGGAMPPFLKKMLDDYKSALAKNPKDLKALTGLANMYYDSGQYTKAIDYYEKVVEIDPKNSNVLADLGTCYFYTDNIDKALKNLNASIEAEPSNLNARYNLGIVYKNNGKKDQARKEWEAMRPYLKTDEEKKKLDGVIENLEKSTS